MVSGEAEEEWIEEPSEEDELMVGSEAEEESLDEPTEEVIESKYQLGNEIKTYKEAIKAYKEVIKIDPDNDVLYANLGFAYSNLKDYKEAVESYEKAVVV